MVTTTRRHFLKKAVGGATLGAAVLSGLVGLETYSQAKELAVGKSLIPEAKPAAFPWPYKEVDPIAVAERAYRAYYEGGCMYGTFEGIVGELKAAMGAPYTSFPTAMMKYGAAGVAGWGTLCGALNGAAAAISLVHEGKIANPIINELYAWYGADALPNFKPRNPKFEKLIPSVADSQLCHVSVTTWCEKSGFKSGSPERAERCAWLTASVAKYTAELLNKQAVGRFTISHAIPVEVKECISCHRKDGKVADVHAAAQTSCVSCHSDILKNHPIPLKK